MKVILASAAVLGIAAFAAMSFAAADIARADVLTVDVEGTGAEENPPVDSPGSARARFTFDTETNELTFSVTVNGISENQVTAAHIHRGAAGTNGPVVHPLSAEGFTQVAGTIQLSDEDVADLAAGNLYLNVHSMDHPGGFARAQIVFPSLTAAPADDGGVTPPSTGDAGLAAGTSTTPWSGIAAAAALLAGGALVIARRRA